MQSSDLNLLPVLAVVLDEASVTRAAHRLHLSPSATSRALERARVLFGDPLLVRHGRGVTPTPMALQLLPRLKSLLHEVDDLLERPAPFDPAKARGRIVISTSDAVLALIGAALTDIVRTQAPVVELTFQAETASDVEQIRDGAVTLGIGSYGDLTPDIDTEHLTDETLIGVLRADHPRHSPELGLETFAGLSHIVVSRRGRVTGFIDTALRAHGLRRSVSAVLPSALAALHLVAGSDATTVVPERVAELWGHRLVTYPIPVPTAPVRVVQIWHHRYTTDPTHLWLRACVRATVRTVTSTPAELNSP